MRDKVVLWHELVHRHYGEDLYYYFIGVRHFDEDWEKQFTRKLEQAIPGCGFCLYKIYGLFDILLRIWLNERTFRVFADVVASELDVSSIRLFQVAPGYWHWAQQTHSALKETEVAKRLTRIGSDHLRDVQDAISVGGEGELEDFKSLEERGLVIWNGPITGRDEIKFFVTIGPPPRGASLEREQQIAREMISLVSGIEEITKPSLYMGRGEAWALLKGTVKKEDYFKIGELVTKLTIKVSPSELRTVTYLARTPDCIEADYIADDSLKAPALRDKGVLMWLPELEQSTVLSPDELLELVMFVKARGLDRLENEFEKEFIREILASRITGRHEVTRRMLLAWLVDVESDLRGKLPVFAERIARKRNEDASALMARLKTKAGIKAGFEGTLGELMVLYRLALTEYFGDNIPKPALEFVGVTGKKIAEYRNQLVHGTVRNSVAEKWRETVEFFVECLPKYAKLLEVISNGNS